MALWSRKMGLCLMALALALLVLAFMQPEEPGSQAQIRRLSGKSSSDPWYTVADEKVLSLLQWLWSIIRSLLQWLFWSLVPWLWTAGSGTHPWYMILLGKFRRLGEWLWIADSFVTFWQVAPWWCSWFGWLLAWVLWLAMVVGIMFLLGGGILFSVGALGMTFGCLSKAGDYHFVCLLGSAFVAVVLPFLWFTPPLLLLPTCPCTNGTGVLTTNSTCPVVSHQPCSWCDPGYTLIGSQCKLVTCECEHGKAATGVSCPSMEAKLCGKCDEGFYLQDGLCRLKRCSCEHGTGANGSSCSRHGEEACVRCEDGYELQNGTCPFKTCSCEHGDGAEGTSCPARDAAKCDECKDGFDLQNDACVLRRCACENGVEATGITCPLAGAQRCHHCKEGFKLIDQVCMNFKCAASLKGVRPARADLAHNDTSTPLTPCAELSAFNGTCSVPSNCLAGLPDSNPLKKAVAFTKGVQPVKLGIPSKVLAIISASLVAVPIVYASVTCRPFMLIVEISISSADFASDVLNTFGNDYYSFTMFVIMLSITLGAGVVTIVGQYAEGLCMLLWNTFNRIAWVTSDALAAHGFHQVFPEHGDSAEKFLLNIVVSAIYVALTPIILVVVAPVISVFHLVLVFLLGVVLHSLRLLLIKDVLVLYESLVQGQQEPSYSWLTETKVADPTPVQGQEEQSSEATKEHVSPRKYHLMVFIEIVVEAGPSIGATLLNYKLMRDSFMVEQLSWVSTLSICFSCYLLLRVGYKYAFHLAYMRRSFEQIPLPYKVSVEGSKLDKDQALAGGAAAAGVGGATVALVTAAALP